MKPRRGEVWNVNFTLSTGAEIQKNRPAVVMNAASIGRLPLCIVVPITNWRTEYEQFDWFIFLSPTLTNGLSKESGADTFQVKSISEGRFVQKLGELTFHQITDIASAIALCVGYVTETP